MTILNRIVNSAANRLSLDVRGERDLIDTVLRRLPMAVYWRLHEKGFTPGGIVDIGAHVGNWTRAIRGIFPTPPILMIEARKEQALVLKKVCSEFSGVSHVISLLGREPIASVPFHVSGTGSSLFAERSDAPKALRLIPMRTLDDVLSEFGLLVEPLFLKLDIQGAELECLRGGNSTLLKTEVVQLEVALLNYNEGAPQAAEVISYMDAQGFAIIDIAGFVRPNGTDLVQIDIVFAKKTSHLRPKFFHFNAPQNP